MKLYTMIVLVCFKGLITPTTTTLRKDSPCNVGGCLCFDLQPSPVVTGSFYNVTCQVKAVSTKTKVLHALLPGNNIKALTLVCTSQRYYSHLHRGLFEKFSSLEYLTIDSCVIETIQRDFLSGFTNLHDLYFRRSTFLPPQLSFESQTLKKLTLEDSDLKAFPNVFTIQFLEKLVISMCNITNPTMSILDSNEIVLRNLTSLSFLNNRLSSVPHTFFAFMPGLVNVSICGNNITELSFSANTSLHNLENLEVLRNPLEYVDTRTIASFRNLRQLQMQGVGVPLHVGFLTHLQNLQDLRLSNFSLNSSIWDSLHSSSLKRLDLSSNILTSLNLTTLPSLTTVRLQNNRIRHLNPDVFVKHKYLLLVNLADNRLESIPKNVFRRNRDVKAIALSNNKTTDIPNNVFSESIVLVYLDLRNNSIRNLSNETFMSLYNLRYLFLDNNKLESFPLFPSPSAITHLYISNNSMPSITRTDLNPLKKLLILEANHNLMSKLPKLLLFGCRELLLASFNNNRIKVLGRLGYQRSLQALHLSGNQIRYLPSFAGMRNLQTLLLDDNNITKIPPNTFPNSIKGIVLSHNNISYIPRYAFSNLPHLQAVILMRNKMVLTIDSTSLSVFSKNVVKPVFFLGYTILRCDCNMGFLKVWYDGRNQNVDNWAFSTYYPKFAQLENAYCQSEYFPGEERLFTKVPLDNFVCNYSDEPFCDTHCPCWDDVSSCPCCMACPDKCRCFYGGSKFAQDFHSVYCNSNAFNTIPSGIHSSTNQLFLDGNYFDTVNASFNNLTQVRQLYLNHSRISFIVDGAFNAMTNLQELYLNDNEILSIGSNTFGNISSLRYLYLNRNRIHVIETSAFSYLIALDILLLDTNKLRTLNHILDLPSLNQVTLAFNPWSCACRDGWNTVRYLHTLSSTVIKDIDRLCCNSSMHVNFTHSDYITYLNTFSDYLSTPTSRHGMDLESTTATTSSFVRDNDILDANSVRTGNNSLRSDTCYQLKVLDFNLLCTDRYGYGNYSANLATDIDMPMSSLMALLISLAIFLSLVAILVVFVLWKRSVVQAWIFVKIGVRVFDKKAAADRKDKDTKPFDAFISFCQKDVGFVANELVPALEDKRYRICVHYRDFPVGGDIHTVVQRAIHNSSRTILIVSPHFLKSDWCRFEFQTAHHHVLQKGNHRLIIVVLGDLPLEDIDPDLRTQMKTKTYLSADDPWYWEKLLFALPDISGRPVDEEGLRGIEILSREEDENGVILEDRQKEDNRIGILGDRQKEDNRIGILGDGQKEDNRIGILGDRQNEDKQVGALPRENPAFDIHEQEFRMDPWWGDVADA